MMTNVVEETSMGYLKEGTVIYLALVVYVVVFVSALVFGLAFSPEIERRYNKSNFKYTLKYNCDTRGGCTVRYSNSYSEDSKCITFNNLKVCGNYVLETNNEYKVK